MQNTFSFSRLWLLIKKQWFDNSKLYTLATLALLGLLTIIFIIWYIANQYDYYFNEEGTNVIFFIMLFVSGLIFSSTTFSMLGDKGKGIYWLSVPATALEKLACGVFYSFIVFLTVYLAGFWIIKHTTFFLIELNPRNTLERVKPHDIFEGEVAPVLMYTFLAFQALFLLGSVYFERFAFIKTVLIQMLIGFLFFMFLNFLFHTFLPNNFNMGGLTSYRIYENNGAQKIYELPHWIEDILKPVAKFIWAPVFLTATYFRLKEKEI
ncbi:MAG: hypothetical protein QM802_21115 [Agriterribacter sp.]